MERTKTLAEEFALKPIPKDTHQKYRLTNPRLNKEISDKIKKWKKAKP